MKTTVYEKVARDLRVQVLDEALGAGAMLGTEVAIAREAGISRTSARAAVDQLIDEGLVERRAGRGVFVLKTPPKSRMVELIVPNLGDIWAGIAAGAQTHARENNAKVQVFNAESNFEADLRAIRDLPSSDVQGAIIGSAHSTRMNETIIALHLQGFPMVLVDQRMRDIDIPSVIFDNHAVGYLVGQELLRLGHCRIGFIGFSEGGTTMGRLDGLRDAVNDAGIAFDRSLTWSFPVARLLEDITDEVRRHVAEIMDKEERPTAMVFHTVDMAAMAYEPIKKAGLSIPKDLSVVGIGNDPLVSWLDPTLATVELSSEEMGQSAMKMLLEKINQPEAPIKHLSLPGRWVSGGSVENNIGSAC